MKGLIALAKKNESISDKIVRLYKEGYSIPEIAKEMEMPKDNVPRILEKHFPDYASFEQPVRESADENGNGKKSVFNMSVSELFGKKNKKQENVEPAKVTVNLAMDDDGFVDHSVAAIASMLQKGRSVNDIAGFFNKDPEDIKAVQGCMDEHFKRMNTYKGPKVDPASEPKEEPAQNITDPLAASLASGIAKRKSNMYATGIETPAKAEPASAPVPPEDNSVHLVTPEALKEAEEKAKAEENAKAEATVAEEVPTMDEVEMPSIEPISLDDTMVVSPAPESTMPSIEDEIAEKKAAEAENTNNNEEGENMGMSPMEKMRMFAQEQIELNNKKIDELKASIAETEAKSLDLGKQASDIYEEIVKLQEKAKALNAEKEQVDIQISQELYVIASYSNHIRQEASVSCLFYLRGMKWKIAQMINERSRTSHFCQAEIAPLPYRWWQADVF